MFETILAVAGGAFALLLFLLKIEKGKTAKEKKARKVAETERDTLRVKTAVQETADQIKDDLASKQKQTGKEKEEVIKSIGEIPEEKEEELSEDIKKLAADQSTRARDRAKRLQNDLGPTKR
jgi:gas vesicle protein